MEIFCFLMGVLSSYMAGPYPPIITLMVFFIKPRVVIVVFYLFGIILVWFHQWYISPSGLPNDKVIPSALLQGTIVSIPIQTPDKAQFAFAIEQYNNHPAQGTVQLAWYNNHVPLLHAGQRWRFSVKLKKPRNFLNPGSADYVGSLASRHITWTGYIHSKDNKRVPTLNATFNWLNLREKLALALYSLSESEQDAGIIQALTLNLTNHISQDQWALFRRTGTTHLFGISGEHIALVSGLVFAIIHWLWSRCAYCSLRVPAIYSAGIAGLSTATIYAFLAGFGPPVQRALIGCFFYTLYCLGKQRFSSWQVWRYALVGVLCLEPHAVFMQGFYFSFIAVACLLLTQQRWHLKGYKATVALQLSCLIGLMPLTLYWFSYGSINGFVANLFAIPLVGLLIVPLALVTLVFCNQSWSCLLMKPLSWLIHLLMQGLIWTEKLAAININFAISAIEVVVAWLAALLLWMVLPIKPFNWVALLWLFIPFLPQRDLIPTGTAVVRVLDVGQGLAVAIATKNHVLLYDTGDQFFKGSDLGKMVILPYLRKQRIKKIDTIVISHPDKDHRGGLLSIQEEIPVDRLIVNEPRYYNNGVKCHDYPEWQWDGIQFRFLPIVGNFNDKNNSSCILQVQNASGRVLFTGDIEQIAEDYLIKTYGDRLNSEVLIVPHHGSKTSSTYRFLLDVAPKYAIASLGFDNRFHFPHSKTLTNMKNLGIEFYRTDECGMVQVTMPAAGLIKQPICYTRS